MSKLQKRDANFLPQSVPTDSAIHVFKKLHQLEQPIHLEGRHAEPTDPAGRANEWEADIITALRNDPNLSVVSRRRESALGSTYFVAHPIRITDSEQACLECHSTVARAPAAMVRDYGPDNGFNWRLHQVLAAQIVSVPESLPIRMAHNALKTLSAWLAAGAVMMLLILDWLLLVTVIRPVAKLPHMADQISQGKLGEDLPAEGHDGISVIAASFNRMQRSVAQAIKMLERGDER